VEVQLLRVLSVDVGLHVADDTTVGLLNYQ